ncbi:CPBP family intramembrane metalloprotease, partial [bacterium]|nr:CPBP family intramembrane metalloprotease [bacterium]
AYFGAPSTLSFLAGATIGAVSGTRALLAGRPLDVVSVQVGVLAPSLALTMVFGPGALVALLLLWSRRLNPASGLSGLGLIAPSRVSVLLGLLIGVSMAVLSLLVSPLLAPTPTPESLGLLAVAVSKPGVTRTLWCVFAVAIAPVTEEVLFRGVLFAGLREQFTPLATASVVSVVFAAVHVTTYWRYWPALLFVSLLGVCLAAARLRCVSLGPAIAMHFAFNAIAVTAVLLD